MSMQTEHQADALTAAPDVFASHEYIPPRANLLPPEIAERAGLRRLSAAMVAAVVACGAVVGGVYVSTEGGRGPARAALADAQAQANTLDAQQKALAPSQSAHAKVLAAKKSLEAAMGSEVLWSNQLNDLRAHLTEGVRLSSLAVTEDASVIAGTSSTGATSAAGVTLPAGPANASTAAAAGTTTTTPSNSIGTVTLNGVAVSNFAVADWMDALEALPGWSNVYLTSVNSDSRGHGLVSYDITANITSDALSHRYTNGS